MTKIRSHFRAKFKIFFHFFLTSFEREKISFEREKISFKRDIISFERENI